MTDASKVTFTMRPEMVLAAVQRGLACWTQASTEVAHGLISAAMAQMDAARTLCAAEACDWTAMATHVSPHEAGERLVSSARARYAAAVEAYRKINDDFAARIFKACETMMSAFTDAPPAVGAVALPAPEPETTAAPVKLAQASASPESGPVLRSVARAARASNVTKTEGRQPRPDRRGLEARTRGTEKGDGPAGVPA